MNADESSYEREVGVDVQEVIREAHANATQRGFWQSENVGEKLALIATEVMEFEDSRSIEEVADIVIRTFDLAGHLDISLPADCLVYFVSGGVLAGRDFALFAYRFVARATQAHRKGKHDEVALSLSRLSWLCARFSYGFYGRGALVRAIEEKMKANRSRPHMHGNLY